MDFAILPPEVNSGRMYSGVGAGPLLAAAAAWHTLAGELHAAAGGYQAAIAELAGEWSGPSATAMTAAATPYATWMQTTAGQAEQTAAQAQAAATAYQAAFAMTVPPPVIAANRSQLQTLLTTNLLGQNTAAIAATESHYSQMWAQDVAAMYHYADNAATASTLKPFAAPPPSANPAGTADQVTAAGRSAAAAATGQAQSALAQFSAVPNALQGLTSPASAAAALGSSAPAVAADPTLTLAYLGLASSLFGTFIIDSAGTFGVDVAGSFGIDLIGVGEIGEALEAPLVNVLAGLQEPTAELGRAARVGALSVPQAWTVAAPAAVPQLSSAAAPLGAVGAATGTAIGGVPFAEMAIAGLAGRALAVAGRGRRTGAATPQPSDMPPPDPPPSGPITGVSAELRELAELRAAGILTEDEFTEQKHRLLDQ